MVEPLLNSLEAVDKEKTSKLVDLARDLIETKKAIEESEKKTKELKEKARVLSEEQIPNFLQEMNYKNFTNQELLYKCIKVLSRR